MADQQSPVLRHHARPTVQGLGTSACATLLLLACAVFGADAQAQSIWKWRDATGAIQISDRPPPKEVPDKDVLLRPALARAASSGDVASMPASAASAAILGAAAGVDADLEARKRKLQQEQQQAKQEQEAAQKRRQAAARAENCDRARSHLAIIDSGQRMARLNSQGEREVLDDKARAAERQRTDAQISQNCR
jgi:hypothetical protein